MTSKKQSFNNIKLMSLVALGIFILILTTFAYLNRTELFSYDFGTGTIAKNNEFINCVTTVKFKGTSKLKVNVAHFQINKALSGTLQIGSDTYQIPNCEVIYRTGVPHYLGTLVNKDKKVVGGFVLDLKFSSISITNFQHDLRINAPAQNLDEFKVIDSYLYR